MLELRKRFGRLVAAHRKRVGLTQDGLAAAAGLSVDMIARIESGATGVRFITISKLATALGVDPAELFSAEMPAGSLDRSHLNDIVARLAVLPDKDLTWVEALLDVALRRR